MSLSHSEIFKHAAHILYWASWSNSQSLLRSFIQTQSIWWCLPLRLNLNTFSCWRFYMRKLPIVSHQYRYLYSDIYNFLFGDQDGQNKRNPQSTFTLDLYINRIELLWGWDDTRSIMDQNRKTDKALCLVVWTAFLWYILFSFDTSTLISLSTYIIYCFQVGGSVMLHNLFRFSRGIIK